MPLDAEGKAGDHTGAPRARWLQVFAITGKGILSIQA
jgi:hypothetical protein